MANNHSETEQRLWAAADEFRANSGHTSDHVTNGLLLRADIHTLFDLDLIGIHPEKRTIALAKILKGTDYVELAGRKLEIPINPKDASNREALVERWKDFCNEGGRYG